MGRHSGGWLECRSKLGNFYIRSGGNVFIMIIPVNKFCVYEHWIGDRLVYVGKGRPSRAFQMSWHEYSRGSAWVAAVGDATELRVEIVSWHESEAEAIRVEAETIRRLKPPGNGVGAFRHEGLEVLIKAPLLSLNRRTKRTRGKMTGEAADTVREFRELYG